MTMRPIMLSSSDMIQVTGHSSDAYGSTWGAWVPRLDVLVINTNQCYPSTCGVSRLIRCEGINSWAQQNQDLPA